MTPRTGTSLVLLILSVVCLAPAPALGYIGPGGGLSAIGAFLAALAAIILAVFGFLWYPVKRLLRRRKRTRRQKSERAE